MHANLKRYIESPKCSLDRMVDYLDRMVVSQQAEIRKSFENSLIVVKNHHKIHLFDNLRGRVSHKALDLLVEEIELLYVLRKGGGVCGCLLHSSCGLPCACRLADYMSAGRKIPLDVVDPFWTKLDLLPSSPEASVNLEENLAHIYDVIDKEPPIVQKNILSKIKAVVFPSKSDKKPPVVQKQTRGRPTLKVQQEREEEAARNSAYIPGSQQSRCDPPRHSSYIPSHGSGKASSDAKSKKSAPRRRHPTTTKEDHSFVLIQDDEYLPVIMRYKDDIPPLFHRYISRITNVLPDGNCGFRAVAVSLGFEQKRWPSIRSELLEELQNNQDVWRDVFDTVRDGEYDRLRHTIHWPHIQAAPDDKWMWMPYTGLLIAQKYGVVLHVLSVRGSYTFFPLMYGPLPGRHFPSITIVHVPSHYISVYLEGDYPVPIVDALWSHHRFEGAAMWEEKYKSRITRYIEEMNPGRNEPRETIKLSLSSYSDKY